MTKTLVKYFEKKNNILLKMKEGSEAQKGGSPPRRIPKESKKNKKW